MVLMTMIARLNDGLPLAASVQDDETVSLKPIQDRIDTSSRLKKTKVLNV